MKQTILKYAVIGIATGVTISLFKKENRTAVQTTGKNLKNKWDDWSQEDSRKETLEKVVATSKQFSTTAANVVKQTLPQLLTVAPAVVSTIKGLTGKESKEKREGNKESKASEQDTEQNDEKKAKESDKQTNEKESA
ncbi:peptidase U61 [Bacillus thuringiensis]|uniref:peptidase U61 n=1 Tax=Bacillus thuringiensis TaxID=1428 RepID=UPI003D068B81